MRILFVSSSPICGEISIGNTFLNLFSEMKDVELASIYTRSGMPNSAVSKAFLVTEKMIVKSLLKGKDCGKEIEIVPRKQLERQPEKKNRVLRFLKTTRWTLFFWAQEAVWKTGRWKSAQLNKFLEEYKPDVVFTVFSGTPCLNNLVRYVQKKTGAPLAVYAWDNNYTWRMVRISPLQIIHHFFVRRSMRRLAKSAQTMYVISNVQKKDYEKAFKRECKLLTKGYDFEEEPVYGEIGRSPLQLVFTGNININRWKSLKIIAQALQEINKNGTIAEMKIYTATQISKKMDRALNVEGCSRIMGAVPSSQVGEIQKNADILIHVESHDLKNRLLVRQSFSTKVVDYLKMARPILAVGPKSVASIAHLVEHNCAVVAENVQEVVSALQAMVDDPQKLRKIAQRGYECGKKCHNKRSNDEMLRKDLFNI